MRNSYLIKSIPFLSTLIIIFFLAISNKNENTRLKILIWNTPTSSLGIYLGISSASGFLFSYFITKYLANSMQSNLNNSLINSVNDIQDKEYLENDINNYTNKDNKNDSYQNIMIERDIKDPSPTMDANFRVIGKIERYKSDIANNKNLEYDDSNYSIDNEEENYQQRFKIDKKNQNNIISTDWNDDSYVDW